MKSLKWFSPTIAAPIGTTQNERFAERLDGVWFKKPGGGIIRLGHLLLTLIRRITALEEAAKPKPVVHSMQGIDAHNIDWPLQASSSARKSPFDGAGSAASRTATGAMTLLSQPWQYDTTMDRTIRVISFVMSGKANMATLRHNGYKITVEKENSDV